MKNIKKKIAIVSLLCTVFLNTQYINAQDREDLKSKTTQQKGTTHIEKVREDEEPKSYNTEKTTKDKPGRAENSVLKYDYFNDPRYYKTVNKGDLIGKVFDSWGATHRVYFGGINSYTDSQLQVIIKDKTTESIVKDEYVTMEFFKNNNGYLSYMGSVEFDTWGYSEYTMGSWVYKSDYADQKDLYIRIGLASQSQAQYYTQDMMFKAKNPFAMDYIDHWAQEIIQEFMDKGIVEHATKFRPDESITRAEFVKILNKVFGLNKSSGKVFTDTRYHWAKYEIDVAVTNGVCNGKTATEFKPDDPITREEASVMIANYKNISDKNLDKLSRFKDAYKVSSWAKPSVEGIIEKGYMGGYSDNTFRPKEKITRAEAVSTLSRIK